jgi:pilus assembly protein Flp/PilA
MKRFLKKLATEDSGQDLIEYALVAALVGLGAITAMKGLSNSIKTNFNAVGNSLTNAVA